jgi:tetratricopeptide (TPR) repeat protein
MSQKKDNIRREVEGKLASLRLSEALNLEAYGQIFNNELNDEALCFADKKEGNYNLLAKAFEDIGDKHRSLALKAEGDVNKICKYYTDALLHYQYASQIREKFVGANVEDITRKTKELYQNFHSFISGGTLVEAIPELDKISHKQEIMDLREKAKAKLQEIKSIKVGEESFKEKYTAKASELLDSNTSGMKEYLANIVKDAEKALGASPCKYSVIGLGSISLKQITPYSDLEFAILVAEDNEQIQEYFAKLGHYINFAVTALGETTIPYSSYKVNLDIIVKRAVNLDLGGKVSLGREDKDYKLVCSIDQMIHNMNGEHNEEVKVKDPKRVDAKLPLILQTVCHVAGEKELTSEYQARTNEFLQKPREEDKLTNGQKRALDILSGENLGMKSNLEEFAFKGVEKEGHLYDVKQEIYRVPDRMIYNLGQLYNVPQEEDGLSAEEVIDKLQERGIINEIGSSNLKFALSYANMVRMRTYDFYGEQKEYMEVLPGIEGAEYPNFRMEKSETEFGLEEGKDGGLLQFYYTTLPFMQALKKLCESAKEEHKLPEDYFKDNIFCDSSNRIKADICIRLMRYEEVIKYGLDYIDQNLHKEIVIEDKQLLGISHCDVGRAYLAIGKYKESLEECDKSLRIQKEVTGKEHIYNADIYSYIASAHEKLGEYVNTLESIDLAINVLNCLDESIELSLHKAIFYSSKGSVLRKMGKWKDAKELYNNAIGIQEALLSKDHTNQYQQCNIAIT